MCSRCQAVFNQFSKLRSVNDDKYWDCEFCQKVNEIMIEDEELPQSSELTYLIEAPA